MKTTFCIFFTMIIVPYMKSTKKSFPGVKSKIQIHENFSSCKTWKFQNPQNQTQIGSPNNSPILVSANERHSEGNMMKMMGKSSQPTTLNPSPSPSAALHL